MRKKCTLLAAGLMSMTSLLTAGRAELTAAAQTATPSYQVLITGEVRYPGRATLTVSTMTVLDALAAVGSPTSSAGDEVIVIHAPEPGALPRARTLSLKDMELGRPGIDATLQDGDIVNVPQGKRFYAAGLVKRPGAYRWRDGTTVSQAILLVGGLADGANEGRIRIRRIVSGKPVEVAARPDDKVLPNDEIKVPRRMF
jgi:protein involved in polysaccharide export with SLBB domain